MEFWGIEVKAGEPLVVTTGDNNLVHISQATLGEAKNDKANGSIYLYLKIGDKKLVLGTLYPDKIPQIPLDLVFERDFELSHNWKNGSVYFTGYTVPSDESGNEDSESEFDTEVVPAIANHEKPESQAMQAKPSTKKGNSVKIVEPYKDEKPDKETDDSSDEENDSSSDDESADDQAVMGNGDDEDDDESEDEDEDEDEDDESEDEDVGTPAKAETSKKRSAESATKTPLSNKKANYVTPQKTAEKKKVVGHVATPHPSKQILKTSANSDQKKEQTPKTFYCKPCSRSFGSENALQSHTKAKHGTAK